MKFKLEYLLNLKSHKNNNPAVITKDSIITYDELNKLSSSYAETLSDKIFKGEYIGIYSDNSPEFIVAVIALWKLGAIPVPLNLLATDEELLKLISFAEIKHIITNKTLYQKIKTVETVEIIFLENEKNNNDITLQLFTDFDLTATDEAVVVFTSGVTDEPKGVVHTFHSLLSSVLFGNEILNHSENDRWLASLPFYHIGGFQIVCRALYYGASIIIPESLKTNDLIEVISELKPTLASFVSTQLKRMMEAGFKPNTELKCSLIGGGFVAKELLVEAKKTGWYPVKVYGSSETASFITALNENNIELKSDSIGKPVGNTIIKIIHQNGNECPSNVQGDIVIQSDSLFKKYLNNETATNERILKNSYFTGDIGYYDEDGFYYISGRKNDMIVSGGENVNPFEVEQVILKYPGITEAVVFPINDVEWGEIVCAVIVTSTEVDISDLKLLLKKKLAPYKIPKQFFIEDSLPKTSLGKVEIAKLKMKYSG
ncbi:MAG: AMP-binding protein [Ignavibacteriaceae bacterium]|nr:AMP-binding protein [Ignavibacteriaceae bacterium]